MYFTLPYSIEPCYYKSLKSEFISLASLFHIYDFYSPGLKKPWFEKVGLYWIWVVPYSIRPYFRYSVRHKFVFAQYLENKLIDFYQILYMHRYCQDLGLLHIIFRKFVTELWPLSDVGISFRISFLLNILQFDQILYVH